jgi:catechol 2,3-dioxygenase-like lactoylglutathione lyase family enzyme
MAETSAAGSQTQSWVKGVSAITLVVEDLDAAKEFYGRVFDLPTEFEDEDSAAYKFGELIVNLLKAPAAREMIEPAPVAPPEAGARFQFTLLVDDVDAACADLASRGVDLLNGPIDRPWGIRTASFRDPAGHIWEVTKW